MLGSLTKPSFQSSEFADLDERFEEQLEYWDDDDDSVWENLSEEESKKLMEEKRRKNIERHRRMESARREKDKLVERRAKYLSNRVKAEGEIHEKTVDAEVAGWYRACIMASFNKVSAIIIPNARAFENVRFLL